MHRRAAAAVVGIAAAAVWMGGMIVLGAVVAPVVFRNVPAPTSADAMILVFRRFDHIAMGCAAVVVLSEVLRGFFTTRLSRGDFARGAAALAASALALWQGLSLSPRIQALHQGGAVRGLGPSGIELETIHKRAELVGKLEVALLIGIIALHVLTLVSTDESRRVMKE